MLERFLHAIHVITFKPSIYTYTVRKTCCTLFPTITLEIGINTLQFTYLIA